MAKITETELQKRLRKLESAALDPADTVVLTDDQYTLSENVIYVAYASALSNLVNGSIPNQSDATDFQYSPYNAAGVLMAYRGYFSSTSIYASGDPTDYTWESTSGLTGFTSSERYYTTSTGLLSALGNPTEPGSGITWTIIASGNAIPGTAVWYAERFTVSGITSGWTITAVGAYVNSSILQDDSVTTAKIVDNAITATEIADNTISTGQIATNAITSNEIAANAITASELAAGAISAGSITATEIATNAITADKVASNAITSAKVNADAITVDKIDLDGQLNVTANNGSILWGKTGSTDTVNTGLFLGRDGSGNPRIVFGNASSFINFDGTDVSLVNCDVDNNAGTNAVIITSTTATTTYTIGPNIATINIQLSGGGGGGGGQSGDYGEAGTAGGASSVVVYTAAGSPRTGTGALNISASGGAGGAKGGGGNPGGTGGSFSHGSATEPPFTDAAGGAGSTHVGEPASRPTASNGAIPSAGGGGNGNAGGSGGAGGAAGSYNSTTYTVVDTTDYLVVTVGAGGEGDDRYVNNPGDNGGGGDGGRGVVRLQGALS